MEIEAKSVVIALDVGGSSVKHGAVRRDGRLVSEARRTPIESRGTAAEITETLGAIVVGHLAQVGETAVLGVGMGFPGPFEYDTGVSRIEGVAKYEAIFGLNVGEEVQQQVGMPTLPIRFRNDAEAAIVGEGLFGAGRPFSRLIGVTLGTGCGSAFLVDGQSVVEGTGVPPNGWLYPMRFEGQQADDLFSIRGLQAAIAAAGIGEMEIKAVAEDARHGNEKAQALFADFGKRLGLFLRPFAHDFGAEAILLLGGISQAADLFLPFVEREVQTAVVQGTLGADGALLGAAALF